MKNITQWLPLDEAAQKFGYAHKESLARRLRQLRRRGQVVDLGHPPEPYRPSKATAKTAIVLLWPNPKTALLRRDAPAMWLDARPGKRAKQPGKEPGDKNEG